MKRQLKVRVASRRYLRYWWRPGVHSKFIRFLAPSATVGLMIAAGLAVARDPLYPTAYIVPDAQISEFSSRDLISQHDFFFLASVTFLFTPTGSNQTWTDATFNTTTNTVEAVGAGGSGGTNARQNNVTTGGGGGEYRKISNFNATTATYQIGTGGVARVQTNAAQAGADGGDTWFDGTTSAGASLSAHGGKGGLATASTSGVAGGAGGTGGIGAAANNNGGAGGAYTGVTSTVFIGTGGGGAGGPNGVGTAGVSDATGTAATGGGQGDGSSGGAGGALSTTTGVHHDGSAGLELGDLSKGCGGGGGGTRVQTAVAEAAGSGGNYGAGGGGCANHGSGGNAATQATSGAGAGGLIILTWTPAASDVLHSQMIM